MSAAAVVPQAIISATARRVPSRTKSAFTQRCSNGQMVSASQASKGCDSPMPRSSDIARWPWALTSPGISTWLFNAIRGAFGKRADNSARPPTARISPPPTATAASSRARFRGAMGSSRRGSST